MFFEYQPDKNKQEYQDLLKIICSLSKLFSENESAPYLYYRVAERIFCQAFHTDDLTRSDVSIDVKNQDIGIGLKTFLYKTNNLEKVAEFNKQNQLYSGLDDKNLAIQIAKLRNDRIRTTCKTTGVDIKKLIYHCVVRNKNKLHICESPLSEIDINKITLGKAKGNIIYFNDSRSEYAFNKSKSTLYKRFDTNSILDIDIVVEDNPFGLLKSLYEHWCIVSDSTNKIVDSVVLALYSERKGKKFIAERSGLNHWNANGRARHLCEAYIPIRSEFYKVAPNFFPPREETFTLKLPNGISIIAKICQDKDKALMSNPNKTLGEWLLRDMLSWKEGELLHYKNLLEIGIDSVLINKFEDGTYDIHLKEIGSYEDFIGRRKLRSI